VRLSTFGSVILSRNNFVSQVDGSSCEVPAWMGTQGGYVLVEPVLCATFNIWFSNTEQMFESVL